VWREDLQRRGHRDARARNLLHRCGIVVEMTDVRRVHEHVRPRLNGGQRVDHRYRVGDRRQIALLPFSDDQLQRVHFRPAWRRRDDGFEVVVLAAGD